MNNITHYLFKKEYFYGQTILTKSKSGKCGNLTSRIYGAGLSAFALLNLSWDVIYITRHTLGALKFSITHKNNPIAYCETRRNMLVTLSEFLRHIKGTLGGTLIGVCSPEKAVGFFLPSDQTIVQTRLTKKQAARLYEMAKDMHDLFAENGIEYCMTSGTQLGSTRHGGIMPHDDDVDVFVMESERQKIENLSGRLREKGIGISVFPFGYKFCDIRGQNDVELIDGDYRFPFIDICLANEKNGRVTYIDPYYLTNYSAEYLTSEEWRNKTLQKFGEHELYGALNPKGFCKRMYGDNVFKYGYTAFDHKTGKSVMPKKFYLKRNLNGLCDPVNVD